jgi:hypothetical protein
MRWTAYGYGFSLQFRVPDFSGSDFSSSAPVEPPDALVEYGVEHHVGPFAVDVAVIREDVERRAL